MKMFNFLKKKEKENVIVKGVKQEAEIKLNKPETKVNIQNERHISFPEFAIEGIEQDELIKLLNFKETDTLNLTESENYIWPYWKNPNKGNHVRTIISEKLDNWIFIFWSNHLDHKKIINKLLNFSKNKVNYYSMDSVTSHYEWIIAENGKITREFHSCWNIEKNIGNPITSLEKKFIESFNNDKFVFGEFVVKSIYDKTCGLKLEKYTMNTKFKVGTIEVS